MCSQNYNIQVSACIVLKFQSQLLNSYLELILFLTCFHLFFVLTVLFPLIFVTSGFEIAVGIAGILTTSTAGERVLLQNWKSKRFCKDLFTPTRPQSVQMFRALCLFCREFSVFLQHLLCLLTLAYSLVTFSKIRNSR